MLGATLGGKYRLDRVLGRGGFGIVYRATHVEIEQAVAIKLLAGQLPDEDGGQRARFQREAKATSKLRHPNTIRVYDFGEADSGNPFIVMEFLEGAPLSTMLKRGPLPWHRAARIAQQITKSLAEAHEHGVIHRDLKPDNVMLCDVHGETDFVKVLDFGIAKICAPGPGHQTLTEKGLIIGTPSYIAPELANGQGEASPRSDLYSLGVLLYEMVAGNPPFRGATPIGTLIQHMQKPVPQLAAPSGCAPVPEAYAALVHQLLAKSPDQRPHSAALVAARLDDLLYAPRSDNNPNHDNTIAVEALHEAIEASSSRSRTGMVAILAAAVVLALAVGGWFAWQAVRATDAKPPAATAEKPAPTPGPETAQALPESAEPTKPNIETPESAPDEAAADPDVPAQAKAPIEQPTPEQPTPEQPTPEQPTPEQPSPVALTDAPNIERRDEPTVAERRARQGLIAVAALPRATMVETTAETTKKRPRKPTRKRKPSPPPAKKAPPKKPNPYDNW